MSDLSLIPEPHRDAARSALTAAFGSTPIQDLRRILGGASPALVYRLESAGRPYLMRLETRRDSIRNPHQYACMTIAAEAGIAPPIRLADDAAGIAIMDFLTQVPLDQYPGGFPALAPAAASLIARLQATTPFPPLGSYLSLLDRLFGAIRQSTLFAPGLLDPHAERFARIRAAYAEDAATHVSAHNDPNFFNVIYNGSRLWLIDWETAYRNDPLTDLAILAENLGPSHDFDDTLMQAGLGRAPDALTRARFAVMRVLTRLYYASLILAGYTYAPPKEPDRNLTAPSPDAFRAAIASGELVPGKPETTYLLGKMLLAGFLIGFEDPVFVKALAMLERG